MTSVAAFPLLLKEKSVRVLYEDLPENIIGFKSSNTIVINKCYENTAEGRHYLARLLEPKTKKRDCILELVGNDIVRKCIRTI